LNFGNRRLRAPDELRGVEGFMQITNVNQVVRHAGALDGRRLGGAEVESAIHLHRVHGDDFAADFFREREGDLGFSNRCRPGDEN
jgi:hypothetical protein